jgi:hypothetical protein
MEVLRQKRPATRFSHSHWGASPDIENDEVLVRPKGKTKKRLGRWLRQYEALGGLSGERTADWQDFARRGETSFRVERGRLFW